MTILHAYKISTNQLQGMPQLGQCRYYTAIGFDISQYACFSAIIFLVTEKLRVLDPQSPWESDQSKINWSHSPTPPP